MISTVSRTRNFNAALVACLLIALFTRWIFLPAESLWFDEGWTWWLVSHPAGEMFRLIKADTVAPAYFYALRGWILLFGDGATALRSLSAAFITLALIPLALLTKRCGLSRAATVVVAMFTAWSCMQVQYAREARGYALLALSTLGALAFMAAATKRRSWPAIIGFALCVTLGMYTHNAMAFYAISFAAAWMIWPGERTIVGRLIDLSIAVAICGVLYLPWLPVLREQFRFINGNFWSARPTAVQACVIVSAVCGIDVYDTAGMLWKLVGWAPGAGSLAVCVTVCTATMAVLAAWRSDPAARRRGIALGIVALGPILVVYELSRVSQPIFLGRLFMTSAALMPLILAMSLDRRALRSVRVSASLIAILLGTLGILSTLSLLTQNKKEDWRGAHEYVASLPPSQSRVVVFMATEGELPYLYYVTRNPNEPQPMRTGSPGGFFDLDPPRTIRRVQKDEDMDPMRATLAAGHFDEAILVLSHQTWVDPDSLTRQWFEQNWTLLESQKLRNVIVMRFKAK